MPRSDEFYIGYLRKAPAGLAALMRKTVFAIAALAGIAAIAVAFSQGPVDQGTFEFGKVRTFEGTLYASPVPLIHTRINGDPNASFVNLILIGSGKHGVGTELLAHAGKKVRLGGSLIQRDRQLMLEVNTPDEFKELGAPQPGEALSPHEVVGDVTLSGELVDTKCYLGVMRPAVGKVHRGCAVRCLSGGAPPAILLRGKDEDVAVLLSGADGRPLKFDIEWAALTVTAQGRLELNDNLPVLYVREVKLKEFLK